MLNFQESELDLYIGIQTDSVQKLRVGYDSDKLFPNYLAPGSAHIARRAGFYQDTWRVLELKLI